MPVPLSIDTRLQDNETLLEYKVRICAYKYRFDLTWEEVADIINTNACLEPRLTPDAFRKFYTKYQQGRYKYRKSKIQYTNDAPIETVKTEIISAKNTDDFELKKERIKLTDERTQLNALVRMLSREETLKEIALEVAEKMESKKLLDIQYSNNPMNDVPANNRSATLCISDWHYGIVLDSFQNKYNPEITKERVSKLVRKTLDYCYNEDIVILNILNLGDLISGLIHLPLRINSRYDVITQTIHVSEILAEMIVELSNHIEVVNYLSVTDNHSRLNPNKKESLQIESFTKIIDWYLKERLQGVGNLYFIDNVLGDDVATYSTRQFKILGVHGDKDKPGDIIPKLTLYSKQHVDLILSAHYHHFSGDENNGTRLLCNGSLMGTDDYANSLRCDSQPSQLLVVHSDENVTESIHVINL